MLSSNAGLWSYVIGDTVMLIERNPPRLLVTGRTAFTLSAFGEHLIAQELDQAHDRGRARPGRHGVRLRGRRRCFPMRSGRAAATCSSSNWRVRRRAEEARFAEALDAALAG